MTQSERRPAGRRVSALDMSADEFRAAGHALVDRIADFHASLGDRAVTPAAPPETIRDLLGSAGLPEDGADTAALLAEVAPLLFDNSLHNGHPRFMGYITSSSAPVGALADLLAAGVNANLARWDLSPLASEIESQAVSWIADFIGYDRAASGLMVSGGNMANFVAFVAARTAMAPWDIREEGNYGDARRLTAYVSAETHTWIQKAADACGLGAAGIRWIDVDEKGRMNMDALEAQIAADRAGGRLPFLVVATAGSISRGAIDPIRELAAMCRAEKLWLHADGAYGAPAAALPEAPADLRALALVDSVAVDPHKWLYCPIEAACVLTRHREALRSAFSFDPTYYRVSTRVGTGSNFHELGMQNTRGFRALKVWLAFRAAGRNGYVESIRDDIRLAERLFERLDAHPEFAAHTLSLSVATFRYVPPDLADAGGAGIDDYLDALNQALLVELQAGGELFLSNAVIDNRYLLRACIVNFRTTAADVDGVPDAVARVARRIDTDLRPTADLSR